MVGLSLQVHQLWCEAIADSLPPGYEATIGERVYLMEQDPDLHKLAFPDVAVTHADEQPRGTISGPAQVATLEPVTVPPRILEGPRQAYIEILHQPDRSLVTALELLSPPNKEQPSRTEYLAKRRALLYQDVHLIELDLLVDGRRLPFEKPLPPADYYYLVSRSERRPDCEVYSWTVRHPLQRLPVPLRAPHPDILVDLASVFTTAYDRGRFQRRINSQVPLSCSLSPDNRRWAESVVTR